MFKLLLMDKNCIGLYENVCAINYLEKDDLSKKCHSLHGQSFINRI